MEYIKEDNAKRVSKIVLGTNYFGSTIDTKTSYSCLDYYLSNGGTALDTAHCYGQAEDGGIGLSERLLGSYLSTIDRERVTLITKGGFPKHGDFLASRLDKHSLEDDILSSLDTLKTPCDIYFLHRDDKARSVSEIMETLNDFISKGYTRNIGASNWSEERIKEANDYAKRQGLIPFTYAESCFSLADSTNESWNDPTLHIISSSSKLTFYKEENIPLLCYSSQAKGLFQKFERGVLDSLSPRAKRRYITEENLEKAERVLTLSKAKEVNATSIILSFILNQQAATAAIIGPSNLDQLRESMSAELLELSEDELRYLTLS